MIISKEKLIARLGDKTGLKAKEVERYLTQLIEEIQETIQQGEPYEIKSFGTFFLKDGKVHFTPDEVLETEINNKYAGMKPIELIGAFKESETGEMPDMTAELNNQEGVWSFDQTEASNRQPETASDTDEEEAESMEGTEIGGGAAIPEEADIQDEPEESSTGNEQDPVEEPPAEKHTEEKQPETLRDTSEEKEISEENETKEDEAVEDEEITSSEISKPATSEKATEGDPGDSNAEELKKDKESKQYKKEPAAADKDPIGRFVAVAASILLVGIVGWLSYEFLITQNTKGSNQSLTNESTQQAQVPSQPVNEVQDENESTTAEEDNPESEQAEGTEKTSELDETSQVINNEGSSSESAPQANSAFEEPYGLQGEVEKSLNSWYTIVVHSLKDADKAEANRQRLEADGYRAMIKSVQLQETLQYRVGIGQFSSVEEAVKAAEGLSEPYKSNNFIKRF